MDSHPQNSSPASTSGRSVLPRLLGWLTWPRIIVCSLLWAMLVGANVYLRAPLLFTARTSLLFIDQPDVISSLQTAVLATGSPSGAAALGLLNGGNGAQRFQEMLQSRRFRSVLIQRYGLTKRYGASAQSVDRALSTQITVRMMGPSGVLGQNAGVGLNVSVTCPAGPRLAMLRGKPVTFTVAEARELCARMANDAPRFLDDYSAGSSVQLARKNGDFIAERMRLAQAELTRTRQRLIVLQRQYALLTPETKVTELTDELKMLSQARKQAQAAIGSNRAELSKSRQWLPSQTAMRVQSAVTARNPMINKIQGSIIDLQAKLAAARASGKLPEHPDVQELEIGVRAAQAQLTSLQGQVEQDVVRGVNSVHDSIVTRIIEREVSLAGDAARLNVLDRNLASVQERIADLPPIAQEYASLSRQAQMQAELVAMLTGRLEVARLEEQREGSGRFQVLDEAVAPEHKSGPSSTKAALLAFLGILSLLCLGLAYRDSWFTVASQGPPDTLQ